MLKTDQQLAARYPKLLIKGLTLAMEATGAKQGIIALKAKYKEAITALEPYVTEQLQISIMPDIYPAGDEVITIWLTTGRRVPPGGIPLNIGVIVNNVQTLINVARAYDGEPVTTRTLTVTGAVKNPITVTVPIGTSLREVLELAGGGRADDLVYINGGPMMGTVITDLTDPVTKTTGLRAKGLKYQGELGNVDPMAKHRLIPTSRLIDRLNLRSLYSEAPLSEERYVPDEVTLKLQQHIGAPAIALVKVGDVVSHGQVVGEIPEGSLGARIHASIDGTVIQVTPQTITIRKGGAAK